MAASSRIDIGDRSVNRCAEGATLTDLEVTVRPTRFDPMATSSRIDRIDHQDDRAAYRCAGSTILTDLEATMVTYQLRSYGGEQSRSNCYASSLLRSR